jgi:hypothetical protein
MAHHILREARLKAGGPAGCRLAELLAFEADDFF